MGIAPASENAALLFAINFQAYGSQHYQNLASQYVPFETAFLSSGKASSVPKISPESEENLLLFKGFMNNYNAFIAGEINTLFDGLVLQSEHAFEFPTEPVSLTVDPMFVYDDSEVCPNSLSDTGLRGEE
ncbi:hypothetical protein R6Q57_008443 [Mikania cordata]